MNIPAEIFRTMHSMAKFDRLGGADSFFGRLHVFEEMLREAHEMAGEAGGFGKYHGMCQYGNCVSVEPTREAADRFLGLGYTGENLREIEHWYESKGTPDCAMATILLRTKRKEERDDDSQ